jgi:hypothetical protein
LIWERTRFGALFFPRFSRVAYLAIDSSLATSASAAVECLRRTRTISDWRHRAAMDVFVQLAMPLGLVPDVSIDVFALGQAFAERIAACVAMRQIILTHGG